MRAKARRKPAAGEARPTVSLHTMRAKRKVLILVSSFLLLLGVYFLLSGARELVWPWFHQKKAARTWPPPAAVPVPSHPAPEPPKRLDHSLFRTGDTVAKLTIPRLQG